MKSGSQNEHDLDYFQRLLAASWESGDNKEVEAKQAHLLLCDDSSHGTPSDVLQYTISKLRDASSHNNPSSPQRQQQQQQQQMPSIGQILVVPLHDMLDDTVEVTRVDNHEILRPRLARNNTDQTQETDDTYESLESYHQSSSRRLVQREQQKHMNRKKKNTRTNSRHSTNSKGFRPPQTIVAFMPEHEGHEYELHDYERQRRRPRYPKGRTNNGSHKRSESFPPVVVAPAPHVKQLLYHDDLLEGYEYKLDDYEKLHPPNTFASPPPPQHHKRASSSPPDITNHNNGGSHTNTNKNRGFNRRLVTFGRSKSTNHHHPRRGSCSAIPELSSSPPPPPPNERSHTFGNSIGGRPNTTETENSATASPSVSERSFSSSSSHKRSLRIWGKTFRFLRHRPSPHAHKESLKLADKASKSL